MRYWHLVVAGLLRKPLRSLYTALSLITAFFLFGLLQGASNGLSLGMIGGQSIDHLYIFNSISASEPLPMAYRERLARIAGVEAVVPLGWFGGYYQDPKNAVFAVATDVAEWLRMYPDRRLPDDQREAIASRKDGVVIGSALAQKFGWRIGDKVTIHSRFWRRQDGSSEWPFAVVGIYNNPENTSVNDGFLFNYSYFDDARTTSKGTAGWFIAKISDPGRAHELIQTIDAQFSGASDETNSQTEKEYTNALIQQIGDVSFIVKSVLGAVFFSVIFLTANTMMQSTRERTPEFGTMKAIGFTNRLVLLLTLLESSLLTVVSAAAGLGAALVVFPLLKRFVGTPHMPLGVLAWGLVIALLLGAVVGLPPAIRAAVLRPAVAIRR
jgi:putative ABC transport system permease protein